MREATENAPDTKADFKLNGFIRSIKPIGLLTAATSYLRPVIRFLIECPSSFFASLSMTLSTADTRPISNAMNPSVGINCCNWILRFHNTRFTRNIAHTNSKRKRAWSRYPCSSPLFFANLPVIGGTSIAPATLTDRHDDFAGPSSWGGNRQTAVFRLIHF
ncbi:hypothetical protein D3C80_1526310 [compost metagenome]